MSRGYRQYSQSREWQIELARQRGLAMQAPEEPAIPQPVATPIRHVNPALLGTKAERDAFADQMLAEERRNVAAAKADEVFSEGRVYRNTRPDRLGE